MLDAWMSDNNEQEDISRNSQKVNVWKGKKANRRRVTGDEQVKRREQIGRKQAA